MATRDVFLDEADYTGPNLTDSQLPVFVLASTVVLEDEARALLDSCFGKRKTEVKFYKLAKSQRGRSQILEFLRGLELDRGQVALYCVHKEYILLAYLIDFWLEPMMHQEGVNLYARGGNIALTNVSYITLGTCLGREDRRELLRRFQVMTRNRNRFAFQSFWDFLRQVVREHDLIAQVLGALPFAAERFGYEHLLKLPSDLLDLGDYGLLQTVAHWREQLPDTELTLFHDRSTMVASEARTN
ncbi:MAG: hypothetical protein WA755_10305 [Candidatus Acidiferrales bacterium]